MKQPNDYILGINQPELDRLQFQHGVWKQITDSFVAKLGIQKGMNVLDAGAGPGFTSFEFSKLVGPEGAVTALEPSDMFYDYLQAECKQNSNSNIRPVKSFVENADLSENYFDIIFSRWVIAFVPDPEAFVDKLVKLLKPGGVIALMDYSYEGLSLYPRGGAFDNMPAAVRTYYRHGGGDPYIGAKFKKLFNDRNLETFLFEPVLQAGGPDSGVFQWAGKFFKGHTQTMADLGIISQSEADSMLNDWLTHENNPDSIFFSPIIIQSAAKKKTYAI